MLYFHLEYNYKAYRLKIQHDKQYLSNLDNGQVEKSCAIVAYLNLIS